MTIEDLFNATVKLEEKEKVYSNAEGEVSPSENFSHIKVQNCTEIKALISVLIDLDEGGFCHETHISPRERG